MVPQGLGLDPCQDRVGVTRIGPQGLCGTCTYIPLPVFQLYSSALQPSGGRVGLSCPACAGRPQQLFVAWELVPRDVAHERKSPDAPWVPGACVRCVTPQLHCVRQRTRTPRSQVTKMGLTFVLSFVHTEVCVRHHDHRWVPGPKVCWRVVRNAINAVGYVLRMRCG